MSRRLTVLASLAFILVPTTAICSDEHLVPPATSGARLAAAASQRQQDLQDVQEVLSSPAAARAATALGRPLERLRAGAPTLADGELRDLAARARSLRADPAAGFHDDDVHDAMVVFLIVASVAILIAAVN